MVYSRSQRRGGGVAGDEGYHRTWYVLLGDLILWITFWVILVKVPVERHAGVVRHPPASAFSIK